MPQERHLRIPNSSATFCTNLMQRYGIPSLLSDLQKPSLSLVTTEPLGLQSSWFDLDALPLLFLFSLQLRLTSFGRRRSSGRQ